MGPQAPRASAPGTSPSTWSARCARTAGRSSSARSGSRSSTCSASRSASPRSSTRPSTTAASRCSYLVFVAPALLMTVDDRGRERGVHLPGHGRVQVAPVLLRLQRVADRRRRQIATGVVFGADGAHDRRRRRRTTAFLYLFGAVPDRRDRLADDLRSRCSPASRSACRSWRTRHRIEDDKGQFALVQRFVFMPMFLFSGTFYPLAHAAALAAVDRLDLAAVARDRARALADVRAADRAAMIVVHLGYLVVLTVVGYVARPPHLRAEAREMTRRRRRDCRRAARGGVRALWAGNPGAVVQRGLIAARSRAGSSCSRASSSRCSTSPRWASASARSSATSRPPTGVEVSYAAFIAPALLAVSAMNGAIYDSTWNVFFKLNYGKLYEGMLVDLARAARRRARRDPLRAAARPALRDRAS